MTTSTPVQLSPMQLLVELYTSAPPDVRGYLDAKVQELIGVEMPKLGILKQDGPYVWRKDMVSVTEVYNDAMEFTEKNMPNEYGKLSATVVMSGDQIAREIDKSIKRVMLEDVGASRHAYITILSTHAKLVKTLAELPLSTEEEQELERDESDPKIERV